MTPADKPQFFTLITALVEHYGKEAKKTLLLGYWIGLNDLTYDAVETAVGRAMRSCKFTPKAVELRELCGITPPAHGAELGWRTMMGALAEVGPYTTVTFEDRLINAAVVSMGGWTRLGGLDKEELEKWERKRFVDAYENFAKYGAPAEYTKPLIGMTEQKNLEVEGWEAPEPVLIESPGKTTRLLEGAR